ncbi:MAG TPA: cation diffusion facilitator family transporter [Acetobacteraceae bacterium]|nr:cation diffusion facilitator family transporter [Acetobacteraceae bacterium]
MPHDHDHDHHHRVPERRDGAFAIGVALNLGLVVVQVVVGVLAGSIALIADAGHNLGDVLGLGLGWWAAVMTRRPPTPQRTYGYGRGTILASFANAALLLIGVGAIALESVRRLIAPGHVAGLAMMWVALAAIAVNGATALLFMRGREHDLNLRGAFLHMAADAGASLGVVIAGLLIHFTGWVRLDPIMGLVIAVVITVGTWSLLRQSLGMAMDAVPEGTDRGAVADWLRSLPGVADIHDLHIWSLSTTETALTVHLVCPEAPPDDCTISAASAALRERFGIGHATFQVERGDPAHPCALAPADVI